MPKQSFTRSEIAADPQALVRVDVLAAERAAGIHGGTFMILVKPILADFFRVAICFDWEFETFLADGWAVVNFCQP